MLKLSSSRASVLNVVVFLKMNTTSRVMVMATLRMGPGIFLFIAGATGCPTNYARRDLHSRQWLLVSWLLPTLQLLNGNSSDGSLNSIRIVNVSPWFQGFVTAHWRLTGPGFTIASTWHGDFIRSRGSCNDGQQHQQQNLQQLEHTICWTSLKLERYRSCQRRNCCYLSRH